MPLSAAFVFPQISEMDERRCTALQYAVKTMVHGKTFLLVELFHPLEERISLGSLCRRVGFRPVIPCSTGKKGLAGHECAAAFSPQ